MKRLGFFFAAMLCAVFGAHGLTGSGDSAVGVLETISPTVTGITVLSEASIEISFSEALLTPDDTAPENYSVSGVGAGTLAMSPDLVTGAGPYTLTWFTGEMLGGKTVTITVDGVQDMMGNPINPAQNSASDTGIGVLPVRMWPVAALLLGIGAIVLLRRHRPAGVLLLLVAALLFVGPAAFAQGPEVTNVTFTQGTDGADGTQVDIYYDLVAPNGPCDITVWLSKDGGADGYIHPVTSITGDIADVVAGTGKHIVWDIRADYPEEDISQARIRVTAVDEAPEPPITILLPGDVPLELVYLPADTFLMGQYPGEQDSSSDEEPQHSVTLSQGFYMGKYEVTQAQWLAVMGSWPGTAPSSTYGLGDTYPAYYVSWDDAQNFITALNTHITNTSQGPATVRLPSEAEWEYAYRAGTTTRFYFGDSLGCAADCTDCAAGVLPGNRSDYMWYCGNNSPNGSKPVGGKLPNAFGLYDMSGNLLEWCEDDWHWDYTGAPVNGSAWVDAPRGSFRVVRGGYWDSYAYRCRAANRYGYSPGDRYNLNGFRVARTP